MFDILEKYKSKGHFFFGPKDELEEVCNAPEEVSHIIDQGPCGPQLP